MDWFLSVSTLAVNWGLGWFGRYWWMWAIHSVNAALWIYYAIAIDQIGLILCSVVAIVINTVSGWKAYKKLKAGCSDAPGKVTK